MSAADQSLDFASRLHVLLLAPYPLIHIQTWEEARAIGTIVQLAGANARPVRVWRPESHEPLLAAVEAIRSAPDAEVLIVVDAHPFLDDHELVRALRLAARSLQDTGGTIVFVGARLTAPFELSRDWTTIPMPLPGALDLRAVLDVALEATDLPDAATRARLVGAALGLTSAEAHRAFDRATRLAALAQARGAGFDWEAAVIEEKRRLLAQSRALEFHDSRESLDAVGGLDALKNWLGERRAAFGEDARRFGLPEPRGLLLVGVQGCGKSLAAKAIAGHWGIPLVRLDVSALFSGGEPADTALQAALQSAAAIAPCVLWVDEIEKGFAVADDGESKRLLGSLLIWMQQRTEPVFFVATSNDVHAMPPELFRRGRLDEVFFVDLPDQRARVEILTLHLRRRGRSPGDFDVDELARQTENFSGAELEQVIIAGLYTAFASRRPLSQVDLLAAARTTVPLYALYETEVKALRTWSNGRARPAGANRRVTDYFTKPPTEAR
jgi:hypothetical protein